MAGGRPGTLCSCTRQTAGAVQDGHNQRPRQFLKTRQHTVWHAGPARRPHSPGVPVAQWHQMRLYAMQPARSCGTVMLTHSPRAVPWHTAFLHAGRKTLGSFCNMIISPTSTDMCSIRHVFQRWAGEAHCFHRPPNCSRAGAAADEHNTVPGQPAKLQSSP